MSFGVRENEIQVCSSTHKPFEPWINYLASLTLIYLISKKEITGKPCIKHSLNYCYCGWDISSEFQCLFFPLQNDLLQSPAQVCLPYCLPKGKRVINQCSLIISQIFLEKIVGITWNSSHRTVCK